MTEFMKQVLPMLRSPHRPEKEKHVERHLEVDNWGCIIGERRTINLAGTALLLAVFNDGLSVICVRIL